MQCSTACLKDWNVLNEFGLMMSCLKGKILENHFILPKIKVCIKLRAWGDLCMCLQPSDSKNVGPMCKITIMLQQWLLGKMNVFVCLHAPVCTYKVELLGK